MKRYYDIRMLASSMVVRAAETLRMERVKACVSKNFSEIVFAAAFLLVTLFIFRGYFLGDNLPGSDSMGLPSLIEAAKYNNSFFSPWATLVGLGYADYPSPVYQTVYFMASGLGISSLDIAKCFMLVSFWLAGTVMFACMRRFSFGNMAAIAATAVFCFNQTFLSQITEGHYYYVLGYALFPLVFLIFYRILSGQAMRHVYLVPAVFLLFGTTAPPNIIVIALIFLGLFSIFFRVMNPFPKRTWIDLALASLLILAFTGLSIVLAADAQVYGTSYPVQETYRWSSSSILDAFTLTASENSFFSGDTVGDWVRPASLAPLAAILTYVIPFLAFCSLLFKEHRRTTIPLALISIAFIFLAKGPNAPLSGLFSWAFANVPFFDTIRVFSRFSMFTGFSYGLMIAYLINGLKNYQPVPGRHPWSRLHVRDVAPALVAILVPLCLLVPSSVMVSGELSSYDLPPSYTQPFEWIGEQEGDFRVLYLPALANYYNNNLTNGYPNTTTLDPGFYSSLYTQKDTVFGQTTYGAWYYLDRAVIDKKLGHSQVPSVLAHTASMRYLTVQAYADENETRPYMNLEDLEVVSTFDGGAIILESTEWSPRASAYSQFSLVTGGREALTTLAGMHLYEPDSEALVFMDQLDSSQIADLLNQTSHIYVYNGNVLDLMMSLTSWTSGQHKDLSTLGTMHTTDTSRNWISSNWPIDAGYTLNPTLYTTGPTSFTVTVDPSDTGASELYLKLLRGPGAGNLTIDIPGMPSQVYDPTYSDYQMAWVKIPLQNLTGPTTITITNDGKGANYIEQLLVTTPEEMAQKMEQCRDLLGANIDKLVYVYMGTGFFNSTLHVLGGEGWGVAPSGGEELSLEVEDLIGDHRYLQVYNIEGHEATASLEGTDLAAVNSTLRGTVFDLGAPDPGDNISIQTTGMYGAALFSGEWQEASRPQATVSYSRTSSDTYTIQVSTDQPIVLQVSESYSRLWEGHANGSELNHIPINSMVNGYLLEAGDHEITVEFQGKTTYMLIIGILVASLIMTTAAVWYFKRPSRR